MDKSKECFIEISNTGPPGLPCFIINADITTGDVNSTCQEIIELAFKQDIESKKSMRNFMTKCEHMIT